jgi:hypothetical protein
MNSVTFSVTFEYSVTFIGFIHKVYIYIYIAENCYALISKFEKFRFEKSNRKK